MTPAVAAKYGLAACCAWEAAAVTTGRIPTFTQLCQRHPVLRLVILAVLAAHLWRQPPAARQRAET